jgi:hypothetical protein
MRIFADGQELELQLASSDLVDAGVLLRYDVVRVDVTHHVADVRAALASD